MEKQTVDLVVQFNGEAVGHISVPANADKRSMELAAMGHPEVQKRLGEATVKGFSVIEDGVVNIIV